MPQFELHIDREDSDAHRRNTSWGLTILFAVLRFVLRKALRFISHVLSLSFFAAQHMAAFILCWVLQRPLASALCVMCIWASANVTSALRYQDGPHPAPLFAKRQVSAQSLPSIPSELFQASAETPPVPSVDMRAVQQALAQRGFYKGAVDGRTGPMTIQAVRDYQSQQGLEVTGVADPALLASLHDDTANNYERDDILVFTLQNRLNQLGFDAGAANGRFSSKTRSAIRQFETAQGLEPTGAISAPLLKALTRASLKSNS